MPNYLKNDVVLVRYPFSDLSKFKIRPAIIVNSKHISQDVLIGPLTSKTSSLLPGEFALVEWQTAQLNVPSAVKRDIYTIRKYLKIKKTIGKLHPVDIQKLEDSLRNWLGL